MHILLTNDDGPPSNQSSPYVHSLVSTLQADGHVVSVILPHVQRSWIGKAHIVGQTLTPTYFRPGTLHKDDGITASRSYGDEKEEWVLVDGTPASCVQIGLFHEFQDRGPVDLVVSGPNYGRNTTAVFALSSGTIGGAMEGAMCGKKSIALSYAFDSRDHDPELISAASKLSTKLIEKLVNEWPEDVHLYSINIPLRAGVSTTKIVYTDMLQNTWKSGSSFEQVSHPDEEPDPAEHEKQIREGTEVWQSESNGDANRQVSRKQRKSYKWAPQFADVKEAVEKAGRGDGWTVLQGWVSVTPLKANFWHLPHYSGEIKLNITPPSVPIRTLSTVSSSPRRLCALIDYPDPYVQPLVLGALKSQLSQLPYELITSISQLPSVSISVLQFTGYESLDFEHALQHPSSSLICAYVFRKALIRKHYLSSTVATWRVKHPDSNLGMHFKPSVHFELDFAEFLDEALMDAWDLQESFARNDELEAKSEKGEWWILKPGMSDGGNGLRLFSSMEELQRIFEEWEEVGSEAEDDDNQGPESCHTVDDFGGTEDRGMTSQLRHFIAQPYIDSPLLLSSRSGRKFHIRTYVLAAGALKVYCYTEMLALFAAKSYTRPSDCGDGATIELGAHLTNTCFQDESTRGGSVHRFWELEQDDTVAINWKNQVFQQICQVTGEVFEAAAREQVVHFQTLPNAFEIFGVDFLVDDKLNVWLLELNAFPDFKQTGDELRDVVVGGLFEEVVKVAVEPFFSQLCEGRAGNERMRLVLDLDIGRG